MTSVLSHRIDHESLLLKASRSLSTTPRPFLRWAGSKQRLLRAIVPKLPAEFGRYYEPFLGSGSLYFLLRPSNAVLGDVCGELVQTYEAVRDNPSTIIRYLGGLDVLDRDLYYEVRARRERGRYQRAARFIFLNRAGWNGLYRVNSRGEFNVPYGAPASAVILAEDNLRACSQQLAGTCTTLLEGDFDSVVETASEGDLVFLDPPYVTGHNNNGFVDYNETLFSWTDQLRLARQALRLADSGVNVIVTNAYHDDILALYPSFQREVVDRPSTLAGSGHARRTVREALIWRHSR